MATKPKTQVVNAELEKFLTKLLKEASNAGTGMSLTDKMKICDRIIKVEQMKHKMQDDTMGSGFHTDEDD